MFQREQAGDLYHPIPYFVVKFASELPLNVLYIAIFVFVTYFTTALSTEEDGQIWTLFLIVNIINIFSIFEGLWLGIVLPLNAAVAVLPILASIQILLMGYFLNVDDIKDVMIPFHYMTIHKYLFAALVMNEFDTFDQEECGNYEICDAEEALNLEFGIWDNIAYSIILTIAMGVFAGACLTRVGYKMRK